MKQQSEMDPINALQHLTNQGTRNPMPAQMMTMGNVGNQMPMANANANPNVLQNLINVSHDDDANLNETNESNFYSVFVNFFLFFSNELAKLKCSLCRISEVRHRIQWPTPWQITCKMQTQ